MSWRTWRPGPLFWAAVLTLGNAAKPAVVDDTAYLLFARQIAAHPADPYGFELFWYRQPEPAMHVLAPPVVPYWLGAGVALFGEHLFLLKLWLFPFAWLFCGSVWALLRRFARGQEGVGTALFALSPAVLPLFNFMLDLPAVALGLAAVVAFVRGCDGGRWRSVAVAGVLAGLAAQTKYTMATVPTVFILYGLLHRQIRAAVLAGAFAVGVFVMWEDWLYWRYGESHFLWNLANQPATGDKPPLFNPLLAGLGGLAAGWALYAGRAVGFGRWVVRAAGVAAVIGYAAVCLTPGERAVLLRSERTGTVRFDLPGLVFLGLGWAVLTTTLLTLFRTGFRSTGRPRRSADGWFLIGWVAIEVAAYFALTPFPAARRLMPLSVALGLLCCRLAGLAARTGVRPERWVIGFVAACGVGLLALDVWDAQAEKQLVRQAADVIGDPGPHRVWTQGHWGWQYYADRAGMVLTVPGRSQLRAGDWLVLPVTPDEVGFYRPYHGEAIVQVEPAAVQFVARLIWDDGLPAQTIPPLYGGGMPVTGRDHPRLTVDVFRVARDWVPPAE